MEVGPDMVGQGCPGRFQALDIGPGAVASKILLVEAPDSLDLDEGSRGARQ